MKKSVKKTFRFSEEDAHTLSQKCSAAKMSESDFIRKVIHDTSIKVSPYKKEKLELMRERNFELNRIGQNLNQIARYVNYNKELDREVLSKLIQLERMINDL